MDPKPGTGHKSRAAIFWPTTLVAIAMLVALLSIGLALVAQFDLAATKREQSVVENGIAQRVGEIARLSLPQVVWDDAVVHLDNRFNAQWARENIGIYLDKTDHFASSFVIDGDGKPSFAYENSAVAPAAAYAKFASDVAPLLRSVRQAEMRRRSTNGKTVLGDPVQASSVAGKDGEIHILTATLVQPDFGKARIKGPHAPILVTDMAMDRAFLTSFAKRFMLDGLHVHAGDSHMERDEAHVALRDRTGRYVATIDWFPQKPGTALLKSVGVPALALLIFLLYLVIFFFRRGVGAAEKLARTEAHAAHLAHHDGLTGLANRINFVDQLTVTLAQMRPSDGETAVLSIDLDRYEEISEAHGHKAGDEYLLEAAYRISALCRPADVVARFSSDEFGIIMSRATAESASALADRLCAAMAEPVALSCGDIHAGCTIGVALVPPGDEATPTDVLRYADLALHRAKQHARGRFCLFENEMDAMVKTRRAVETDLRTALLADRLELHYQPQVNGRGLVTGVEALVRWHHPERGHVSPAMFVPIAEKCGLIMELGMFTLRRAFLDARRWPNLKVAINVSAAQIRSADFIPQLKALVAELGVVPRRFELEITEGILINDDPETQDRLRVLRAMGFALALDDFGTGYSSLSYLRRYPINKIKIDRSFIINLGIDDGADAVVAAIIDLAHALKLSVIAEGVETDGQRIQLVSAGCSNVQGYLFSKAVPAEMIDTICRENQRKLKPVRALAA